MSGAPSKLQFTLGKSASEGSGASASLDASSAPATTTHPSSSSASSSSVASASDSVHAHGSTPSVSRPLEIESADVIRLIEQYLKESGLTRSLHTLQQESGVALNSVDNVEGFVSDIVQGRWDKVLEATSLLAMHSSRLVDLYEHIALELIESREMDAARAFIRSSPVLLEIKAEDPERILKLERLTQRMDALTEADLYPSGFTRDRRRQAIALSVRKVVTSAPPSRLLTLLSMALKWQAHTGRLTAATAEGLDLFMGAAPVATAEDEKVPTQLAKVIKMGSGARADVVVFSPDGAYLLSGSSDGFVEAYDVSTGRIATTLEYQAKEEFLLHDTGITALAFSRDGVLLASGTSSGEIKLWDFATGTCLHKLSQAHSKTVTSLQFSPDGTQLLSSSQDHTVRIHGLKSGRVLKEFRHQSGPVASAVFADDASSVITAAEDGVLRVWSAKSAEMTGEIALSPTASVPVPLTGVVPLPHRPDAFVVQSRSDVVKTVLPRTEVIVQTYTAAAVAAGTASSSTSTSSASSASSSVAGKASGPAHKTSDLVFASPSAKGKLLFAASPDAVVYCFDTESGRLLHAYKGHAQELLALATHPVRSMVATSSADGQIKLWT